MTGAATERVTKIVGLDGLHVHDLRRHCTRLFRLEQDVKTVQSRLGHASAADTLDTDSHW